jgi:hypothetical protein
VLFSLPGFAGAIVGILPTPIDYPMDWILSTHYLQVYSFFTGRQGIVAGFFECENK